MYRTIVVGFHKSDTAHEAVRHAAALAKQLGADLHVVYSYADGEAAEAARLEAESAVEAYDLATAGELTSHVLPGEPAAVIVEVARDVDADLVVVGNKGLQDSVRVVGSVAGAVSRDAPCAVLIAHTT